MTAHPDHKEHKYSSVTGKDTVYVDVDDEITTIIDKLRGSPQKIVALVLPKRATVLQSIVNMKLLKHTADQASKQVVLITAEASLLPLAGSVGLYVAKTLQSKPEVPLVPTSEQDASAGDDEPVVMEDDQAGEAPLDGSKPVGELSAGSRTPTAVDDSIELDSPEAAAATKAAGNKGKLKVPNFTRFRLLLIAGVGGLILLIVLWIVCFKVLPKATVTVKTNASQIESNLTITLDTAATGVDTQGMVVPAQLQQSQKQFSQQAAATGQRDEGTKASGTVAMTAGTCSGTVPADVPAGTGLSASGQTFITQAATSFGPKVVSGHCTFVANNSTPVTAQNNGTNGNIGPSSFTVAGRSDVSANSGSAMSGGTSNIVKIISQADIDGAKQKITTQDSAAVKQELQTALQRLGLYAIDSSFKAGDPTITTSANVGDKADNVTVNASVTYTMFGAKQQDLQQAVAADVKKKIDPSKQVILENDFAKATVSVQSQDDKKAMLAVRATAVAGPDLKIEDLRKQVAGKKASSAADIIKANPGVTDVNVKYSPFWVSSIPNNPSKVTIIIEKPSK